MLKSHWSKVKSRGHWPDLDFMLAIGHLDGARVLFDGDEESARLPELSLVSGLAVVDAAELGEADRHVLRLIEKLQTQDSPGFARKSCRKSRKSVEKSTN